MVSCEIRHLLESQSGLITIFVSEVVVHAEVGLPAQLITRLTVRDTLNHTTLGETYSDFYTHTLSSFSLINLFVYLFIFTQCLQFFWWKHFFFLVFPEVYFKICAAAALLRYTTWSGEMHRQVQSPFKSQWKHMCKYVLVQLYSCSVQERVLAECVL